MSHEMPHIPDQPDEPEDLDAVIEQPTEGFAYLAEEVNKQIEAIQLAIAAYADKPSKQNKACMDELLQLHSLAVDEALAALCDDSDSKGTEVFREAMFYVKGLDERRAEFLEDLDIDNALYEALDDTDIHTVCDEMEGRDFDPAAMASLQHEIHMAKHVRQLQAAAEARYERLPMTRCKEYLQSASGHAFDMAKISVAVFGAIALAKRTKLL